MWKRLSLFRSSLLAIALISTAACGGVGPLARIIQPPQFSQAPNRQPELRVLTPSATNPAGGAGITVWLQITNPNPFGFTLRHLDTTLLLEQNRAATGSFPLGLPINAGQTSVIPIDLSISFADLPALGGAVQRAAIGEELAYALEGTVTLDAGPLGEPTFGPLRLVSGSVRLPIR